MKIRLLLFFFLSAVTLSGYSAEINHGVKIGKALKPRANMSTTVTIGASTTVVGGSAYPNLTQAIADLASAYTLTSGTTTFYLAAGYPATAEPASISLTSAIGTSSSKLLVIKPAAGVTTSITGSRGAGLAIIKMVGVTYVTIDGSNTVGGTSTNLTISNTSSSATSGVVWLGAGCANNTIKNCILTGSGTSSTLAGIGNGSTTLAAHDKTGAAAAGNSNNSNTFQNNTISGCQVGIYSAGNSTASKNSGNTITGNTITSAAFAGIYAYWESGLTVSNNSVTGVAVSGDAAGIALGCVALTTGTVSASNGGDVIGSTVNGNRIGTVVGTGGFSSAGIYISYTATGTNNVVNNSVYGVGATGTTPDFSAGIFVSGSVGTNNVYYNSVYMNGTATGSMPTFAFAVGASNAQTLNLKDNVFQNSLTGGTSTPYAIGAGMSSFTGYTADYNDLYSAGNLGMTGGLASGTAKAAISNWTTTTAEGSHSISADPQFISTANLQLNVGSPAAATGNPVSGITTDLLSATRSGTVPSMGAYETPVDLNAPVITNATIANTSITGTATYTVTGITITDASGVATGGSVPQLYYKKSTDAATTFSPNTSGTNGWKHVAGTLASGSSTNGVWSFGIDFSLLQAAAAQGDVINYFIVSQDIVATPNIRSSPAGVTATSVSAVTVAPAGYTTSTFSITGAPLAGNYLVGTGQTAPNFATITAAVSALNLNGVSAATTFLLTDASYTLVANTPLTINSFTNGGNYAVTIKPNTGVTSTITGSSTTSIINLNGAKYVTIDGSNSGGTTQNLTVTNTATSTTSAVIWGSTASGPVACSNNIIKNCIVTGSGRSNTLFGIGFGGSGIAIDKTGLTAAGTSNNNNTVQNNTVSAAQVGIYTAGNSTTTKNTGNTITGNTTTTTLVAGIYAYWESGLTISNNNVSDVLFTGSAPAAGIACGGINTISSGSVSASNGGDVINSTISGNKIGSVNQSNTYSSVGIFVSYASTGTNSITNNSVYGVTGSATTTDFIAGILVNGSAGTTNVYYNSVYMSGAITGSVATFAFGISASAAQTLNLKNNVFQNAFTGGTGTKYAIGAGMSSFTGYTADYNDFFSAGNTGMTGGLSGGTNKIAISNWRTTTVEGSHSISADPQFISVTNLQLNAGSPAAATGNPVSGITTDLLSATRSGTVPSMGAYETPVDLAAPVITYTAIANTGITGTATYTVTGITITDVSGVATGGNAPQLYFKKTTDAATTFSPNTSATNGWKHVAGTLTSGTVTNGVWSFGIDFSLLQTAAVPGDVINYFVVAQDIVATPNVGSNVTGATASSTSTVTVAPPTYASALFNISGTPLSGSYLVGTGQTSPNFATLPAAITSLVLNGINADVSFLLTDATYSLAANTPLTISSFTNAGNNTVTIKPNTGVTSTITGSSTTSIINLNGAKYVTIDGSNSGGTTQNLTVTNTATSATSAVIWGSTASGPVACSNNIIKNCIVTGSGRSNTLFGIGFGGSGIAIDKTGLTAAGTSNNSNTVQNNTVSAAQVGIYTAGNSTTTKNTGNTITGNTTTTTLVAGIYAYWESGLTISNNNVSDVLFTGSASAAGIACGGITTISSGSVSASNGGDVINSTISGNKIGSVNQSNTYSSVGIFVSYASTGTNNIINNSVYGVTGTATSGDLISGILVNGSAGTTNVYYNSVYMNGAVTSTVATFAFGISASAAQTLNLKNNIFQNSFTGGSGTRYAIGAGMSSFTGYTADYNDFFSVGNVGMYAGLTGGTNRAGISNWRTTTAEGSHSISADPQFISTANLQLNVGSPAAATGNPVAGVTTDIIGTTRSATVPSMGAYETPVDAGAPVITYTAIANTGITGTATYTVTGITITDLSGVATGGNAPQLYFKKTTDAATTFSPNTSAANGWKHVAGTLASGTVTNGVWSFGIDFSLLQTPAVPGDVINYFVVAQDIAATPNVGSNVTGATALSTTTVTVAPPTYASALFNITGTPLSGNYLVGTGQTSPNYATLPAAITSLLLNGINADVNFLLTDATYSLAANTPLTISSFTNAGNNTVTIKPNTGVTSTITGSSTTSIINLNGAKYVTIDGSNSGGTTQNLTVTNTATSTTSAVIWVNTATGPVSATNNTVKNCIVTGSGTTRTLYGIGFGGTSISLDRTGAAAAGNGNNNNTVQNNLVSAAQVGIYSAGNSTAAKNSGNTITGNTVTSAGYAGIYAYWESGLTVSNNNISGVTVAADAAGIALGSVALTTATVSATNGGDVINSTISGNRIGSVVGTGTLSSVGIYISYTATGTNNVVNNSVYGVGATGTSPDFSAGIFISGSAGTSNVYYNSVYMSGTATGSMPTFAFAVGASNAQTLNLKDNVFQNALTGGTSTPYAIGAGMSSFTGYTADYNDFFSAGNTGMTGGLASGTNKAAISNWRTTTAEGSHSISVDPVFNTTANLVLSIGSPAYQTGNPVAGITTDILSVTRNASTPSMGAFEVAADAIPPVVSATAIANTAITGTATYTVTGITMSDVSGINTSTFVPQLYFKKSTDSPTVFSPNSSSGTGWKHVAGTLVSGTASSGTWSFGIDFSLLQTSAAVGDVINWFVVAQDAAASPNLASSPAGVTASSTTAITAAPSGYAGSKFTIVGAALSGSYLIGTGNTSPNYATIPDAITDLNLRGIGGNVSFLLTDASYNLGTNSPVVFGGYTNTGANTLTLKPNTGVSSTITGNSASFILNLYGANKVIIDGSNTIGGTTKNLTVINTSGTSTESIIFISTTSGGVGSTNNVIKNCIVTGAGSAFTASGIGIAGPTTTSLGSGNNNNSIINNTVSGAEIGIQTYGASAASPNTGTLISGNSITSATLSGIAVNFEDGIVITGNTITGVANNLYTNSAIAIAVGGDYPSVTTGAQSSSGGGDVTNATVTFNNIGTVLMTGSTNYSAFGIYAGFAGSTTSVNNISNNSIWGVTGTPGGARLVAGIYIGGGGLKTNVYFNSVSMSGAASGASNTFAFASGATAVGSTSGLVLKNNIFSNSITSSSTGVNYGIGFSASTFTGLTSDYNNLYSATGNLAVTGSLASGSGTPQTSLSGLQAVTGEGVNSIGSLPQFNTAVAASDLSLQVGSPALGDGTPVSGITTDILGVTRSVTAPSMGAYEVGKDLSAPVVSFTAFASAGLPGSGTVISIPNITITDGTGTESGTYAPVMYYKKHTDAGTLGVSNTSAGNGWKYVSGTLASGSATNGIYNFGLDYSLLYNAGGGAGTLTVGDVVDYFFVTQDIVSSPGFNLGATPSAGFVGSNVLTVTSAPAAPSSFTIVVPLAGDYYIGAALSGTYLGTPYNSYATITAALADLNSRGVSAATRFLLTDASYSASETFPLSISSFANSGNNPVTIKPCSACVGTGNTAVTISGASANSVINLNGVSNIIIDGSNAVGGTSRDLTITTTNTTTSPAIIWANSTASTPAANNTVKNCIITGNSITKTLAGIGFGAASTPAIAAAGKTAAGKNNNGNTVSNNLISAVQYGIFSAGTSAGIPNTGNVISGNNILSCRFAGIYAYWESGISISGNTITSCSSATNANPAIGIACGGTVVSGIYSAPVTVPNGGDVTGANISGNKILSVVNSTSGGYSAVGIYVSYVAGGTNNLYNNQVAGVTALTTSPDVLAGILVCGGGITNVYHNSVYMPVGNSPGANTFAFAVGGGGSPAVNVKNNIFCNAGPGTALNLAIGLNFSNYTNFVSDYNNLSSGTTGIGIASALNGSTALTYATWQSTTGKDANSFNASPSALFTSSTDLHLGNGTCAFKGRGTAIAGLTTDFDGDVRSSTNPDVGIDEFTVTGGAGTWTGTVSTDWTNGANWCNGSAPVSTDAVTIPGSTKFQPVFSTGFGTVASVTLNSGGTLTVSGGVLTVSGTFTNTGTLTISGGTLNANGAFTNNALAVINQSGGTAAYGSTFNNVSASPGGIYNLTGGTATITGAVTNRGGAQINISGPGTTANFNGNYTNNGAGSVFTLTAGTANFGGNFTNNATTFSTAGGLINFNKSGAQSITSGNSMSIYALTLSASGTKTAAANFTVTNALTIAGGVTLADGGSSITVNGSISNSGTHSGTGAIILSGGSVSHALSGTGSFGNLTLNDANGVQQSGSEITINGALTFTAGTWTTGVNTLLISSTGSVAGAATGKYVNGNLGNWISGSGPEVYTLGSAAGYTPIALTFSGVTTSGYVVANTTAADNAAIATSCIKATNSANRNWNLAAYGAGTVAYASYTAEVTYVASDLDAGASQAAFVMQLYNGSTWQNLSLPAATTNISSGLFSTSAPGYTAFGALQAGFLTTPGVVVSNNNPSPLCPGGTGVTFTATPSDAGVTPTYVWYLNGTLLPAETASTYTNAAIADGDEVYAVVTSSNSCTTNTAQSNKQKFIVYTTGTWLGLSTTWASAGNWCGGIPDGTTDVTILSTAANMPLISGAASARNLNIAAGATLNLGAGAALSVYGTVDNNGLMNPAGGSRMIIAGSSNQSIGGITVHDLTLDNVAGISLSDNITINNTITFTAGNITTGSNSVIFGTSATDPVETSSGKIIGISEMAARSVGTGSLQFLGVGIDAGTDDLGNVSVKRTTGSAGISTGMGNTGIAATWNITAANQPVQGRGATFTWLDPDFTNGRNTSVMQVFRNETGTWEKSGYYQQPTGTATTKTVRVRTRGFSDWTVSDALNPLPVKLVSFAAVRKNELVEVQWATASEVNDSRFEVERSENNKTWHTVSTVAINGNSSTLKHYKITDAGADMKNNNILSYRLKVVDLDGSVWYTHTAQVTSDAAVVKYSIHPNPFGSELMLDLGTSEGGDAVITVTDVLGRTAASGLFTILPGERTVSLEEMVQKLPNDIFNITVNYNGAVQVLRAIKK